MIRTPLALGVLALLAPAAVAQQFTFDAPQSYGLAVDPTGVDSGDLNQDGLRDIVTTSYGPERVDCWFNDCGGAFRFAGSIALPVGSEPGRLEMADFDGDGDDDVAVLLVALDQVMIIFNDGNGLFMSSSVFPVGNVPTDIAVRDYDQDGDVDIIVSAGPASKATLLTNDGAASFTGVDYAGKDWSIGVDFGDVDGDGDIDFAISNRDDCSVWVYTNDGFGVFTLRTKLNGSPQFYCVVLADLDGDGDDDVAVAATDSITDTQHNMVLVYLYDQVGDVWNSGSGYTLPGIAARKVVAADFDCDGDLDLAVSNEATANFNVRANDGTGTSFLAAQTFASGLGITDMVAEDFDHDGAPDIAVSAEASDELAVHVNKGCGLEITVAGQCGGPMDFTVSGATPNGQVIVAYGSARGCRTLAHWSACPGLTLGIVNGLRQVATLNADANGDIVLTGQQVGPGLCGGYIQMIDVAACTVSNIGQL